MSTSTIKIARECENIEGGNNSEEPNKASSQEILGDGNTKIFSTLIPLMVDLDTLKTCRMVCKSWNKFACQALRKLPRVFFSIYEFGLSDADNLLKLLAENTKLKMPSPFGNFKVSATTFRASSFLTFLKYVRDNVNNYSIDLRLTSFRTEDLDPAELQTVLTSNLQNFKITKIELAGKTIIRNGPRVDIFQPQNIRLPHLKTLIINDGALRDHRMVILCETLCHNSPLKFLRIRGRHERDTLKKVMSPGGMKSLEHLDLTIAQPISYDDSKYICAGIMEIPCLKKLAIRVPCHDKDVLWYMNPFKTTIIGHFAESLEYLTGDSLPFFHNKCFPKLREIHGSLLNSVYQISYPVELFPLLKKVTFTADGEDWTDYPSFGERSFGVEQLHFSCLANSHFCDIMKVIGAAGAVFPHVSTLSIKLCGALSLTRPMFKDICESFSKVRSLELWMNIHDDKTLSGLRISVDERLVDGWPLDKIWREVSLLDFPCLEKLSLGPAVFVTKQLLKYCLAQIPKLQYLTFFLNEFLVSAEDVRDSVGHLKRITVLPRSTNPYKQQLELEEMERLRKMLPSVVSVAGILKRRALLQ